MSHSSSPLRRLTGWRRQIALAVLFALQSAISLSPLLETTEKGRMGAHTEQQGSQHKYQHDETTCAVCAVRSLHSSPAHGCPPIASDAQHTMAGVDAPTAPARRTDPVTLPRAPPRLT